MYSGTTLTPASGRILGAHQKIDRLARACLTAALPEQLSFPSARTILHFEGVNGPDAIKRKSPARDEPWHYYMPYDDTDMALLQIIDNHYEQLVVALKRGDDVRASFEAAWLAHAIVDGLTPAHHVPYETQLTELRGGKGLESRTSIREKIVIPGDTPGKQISNNWKMWGPRGLLMSHGTFEFGVAILVAPLSAKRMRLHSGDLAELKKYGVTALFKRKAQEVDSLHLFEKYQRYGWTPSLVSLTRRQLIPTLVQMVALAWYAAAVEAKGSLT